MFDFARRRRHIEKLNELLSCDFGPSWDRERLQRIQEDLRKLPDELEEELLQTADEYALAETRLGRVVPRRARP